METFSTLVYRERRNAFRLVAFSFLILFFELALIRFIPATVRAASYFLNLVLIAAFLGMGTGLILEMRRKNWVFLFAPFLLLLLGATAYFSNIIVTQPAGQTEGFYILYSDMAPGVKKLGILTVLSCLFLLTTAVFIPLGLGMGQAFSHFPPLIAYTLNITGSLLGIVVFALLSYFSTTPVVWFSLGSLLFLLLARNRLEFVTAAVGLSLCLLVVMNLLQEKQEIWSPYYKIQYFSLFPDNRVYSLHVNGSFHQYLIDFSDEAAAKDHTIQEVRESYLKPYRIVGEPGEVLILGAGTGNDISIALRQNARRIDAVELDPEILKLGQRLNPHRAYQDPRVTAHVGDARAYLKKNRKQYDLIVLGTLDSQTLLSGLSSLRLDNYVYTLESFQSIRDSLKPGGRLILYHMSPYPHIAEKIYRALTRIFGAPPLMRFEKPHHLFNYIFIAGAGLELTPEFAHLFHIPEISKIGTGAYPIPTDDWPYLFLEYPHFPAHYLKMGLVISVITLLMVWLAWGRRPQGRPDGPLFFLGAGFLLLETKSVTQMSLLFGSTWQVNILIFFSILLLILFANLLVLRHPHLPTEWLFAGLAGSILLGYLVPVRALLGFPLWVEWVLGGLMTALPLFFAGMVFAQIFKTRTLAVAALGYNLIGSILGGLMEYSSMVLGGKTLHLLALLMYLMAYVLYRKEKLRARVAVA